MLQDKNRRSTFFRARLTALIAERGISQRQLAEGTKLTPQSVSNYVRGARDLPRAEELYALARYFGTTMESFLNVPEDNDAARKDAAELVPKILNPKAERAIARLEQIVERLRLQMDEMKKSVGYVDKPSPEL